MSPVLSNIYLDRLDKYVEQTLVPQYTRGEGRRVNRDSERLADQAGYYRRKGEREKAMHLKRPAQHLPSLDPADPEYRRLRFIRYADDWLIGFVVMYHLARLPGKPDRNRAQKIHNDS